ncbi:MAG: hypothetical protein HWN79_13405 [Candidatus Lokiarchaeota archaeon]|nr:hypothetical protein [Candidatus Lokiarchaeota archaeon]
MEKKGLGIFLAVLGVIFLGISGITIWSMFFAYDASKGVIIILSIPLMAFSLTTIFFGIYLITQGKLGIKAKGLVLLIDGILPVISSIYALADARLDAINELRTLVLLPLILVGIFIIIYGVFLVSADMYIDNIKLKKRANQVLGAISIVIGIINIISFVALIATAGEQPVILSFFWLSIGVILIYFGGHLFIKKVEAKKKSSRKKK